jgi:hypothetical protein
MADPTNRSPLAPTAVPPSVQSSVYETKFASNTVRRGPLRFEEGIATDSDVPNDFILGARQGYVTDARGHNANVYIKDAMDTQRERVHMGSSAWVEAPTFLAAFSGGASNEAERSYIQQDRSGGHYQRHSPAVVTD